VNTKQLAPITGALIAGLIGVEAADCYGFLTRICMNANTDLVTNYPGCQFPSSGNTLVSTGTWYAYDGYEITESGHENQEAARNIEQGVICHGLATYLDCQGSPHTINAADPNSSNTYDRPMIEGYPPPCEW